MKVITSNDCLPLLDIVFVLYSRYGNSPVKKFSAGYYFVILTTLSLTSEVTRTFQ